MQSLPKIIIVKSKNQGIEIAKELIFQNISTETVLFLSGGSTPKPLYELISKSTDLQLGAAAIVDERFGKPMHKNSNEKMIAETGLINILKKQNIRFYKVLENKEIEETAKDYDETVRFLLYQFKKSIGILGIGEDGHIAGIAPNRKDFKNPIFVNLGVEPSRGFNPSKPSRASESELVGWFDDSLGPFKQRITMTFLALSMLDQIIVLAFGKEKKKALKKMLEEGLVGELPARFLTRDDIAQKTIVITDQKI